MLFTGHYEHTIDSKRRLAIPADIRSRWEAERDGAAWYAVPWPGGIIRLYTEAVFKSRAADYWMSLTPDEDEAELLRTLFGLSARLEPDSAGRIRFPDEMLDLVGLGTEVALVGVRDYLEVWDRAVWRGSMKDRLERLGEQMRRIESKRTKRLGADAPERDGR